MRGAAPERHVDEPTPPPERVGWSTGKSAFGCRLPRDPPSMSTSPPKPKHVFRTLVMDRRGVAHQISNRRGENLLGGSAGRTAFPGRLHREREGMLLCLVEGFATTPRGLDTVHHWYAVPVSSVPGQSPPRLSADGRWTSDALAQGLAGLRGGAPTPNLGALAGFLAQTRIDRLSAMYAIAQTMDVPVASLLGTYRWGNQPYARQDIYWNLSEGGARQGCHRNPAHPFRGAVILPSPDEGAVLGPAVPSQYFFESGGTLTSEEEISLLSHYSGAATGGGDLVLLPGWNFAAHARKSVPRGSPTGAVSRPRRRRS